MAVWPPELMLEAREFISPNEIVFVLRMRRSASGTSKLICPCFGCRDGDDSLIVSAEQVFRDFPLFWLSASSSVSEEVLHFQRFTFTIMHKKCIPENQITNNSFFWKDYVNHVTILATNSIHQHQAVLQKLIKKGFDERTSWDVAKCTLTLIYQRRKILDAANHLNNTLLSTLTVKIFSSDPET